MAKADYFDSIMPQALAWGQKKGNNKVLTFNFGKCAPIKYVNYFF
jgi:hypothetical protein